MNWYRLTGECKSGGFGWGKTGQVQTMGNVSANSEEEALEKGKSIFPGGWIITKAEKQTHCHDGNTPPGML